MNNSKSVDSYSYYCKSLLPPASIKTLSTYCISIINFFCIYNVHNCNYHRSYSMKPRGRLLRNALRLPCIRCGGPKGMEPAAGAFTDTRDSRPLQDGIKDSSSVHPVTVPNCLTRRALVMTLFMLRRVRNCRRYYYYYYYYYRYFVFPQNSTMAWDPRL